MTDPRIGLACAGGVVEGAFYEVGVLCALEQAVEGLDLTRLDVYVGVSAGAIVASCLANGISPDTMRRSLVYRGGPLRDFRPELLFTAARREYVRRLCQLPIAALDALVNYATRPTDLSLVGALAPFGSTLPVGLFDSKPLERYMAAVFAVEGRTNDFRQLRAELRIMAVKLDTSELVAFGDEATAHVPISKAVQASAALPGLYCPVRVDGDYYIDGVARRTLNASQALEQGVDLLLCVNPIVPVDMSSHADSRSLVDEGLPAVVSQTFRTIVHSRMRTGFRNYEFLYPSAELVLIEPDLRDHSMFFSNIFSFTNRRRVTELGYRNTLRFLLRESPRLEPLFRRFGFRLNCDELIRPASLGRRTDAPEPARTQDVIDDAWETLDRLDEALGALGA